jgi:hypothetical protein
MVNLFGEKGEGILWVNMMDNGIVGMVTPPVTIAVVVVFSVYKCYCCYVL